MSKEISAQYSVVRAGTFSDRIVTHMRRRMYQEFLGTTGVTPDESILDVGVSPDNGTGAELDASNYLEAWYPHPQKITACSVDDASFLETRYPGVHFVLADGRKLPFDDGSFDVVFSNAVLEHVGSREQQGAFLAELHRVSRRAVFITTPNRWYPIEFHSVLPLLHWLPPKYFRKAMKLLGHQELALEENLNLVSRSRLEELCTEAGFHSFSVGATHLLGWPSNLLLCIKK